MRVYVAAEEASSGWFKYLGVRPGPNGTSNGLSVPIV